MRRCELTIQNVESATQYLSHALASIPITENIKNTASIDECQKVFTFSNVARLKQTSHNVEAHCAASGKMQNRV